MLLTIGWLQLGRTYFILSNIKALGLVVLDKLFHVFLYKPIHVAPRTGPFLTPGALFEQTKYQDPRHCGFRKKFHVFPILAYVKHVAPRVGPFLAQGHNLKKLGGGPLDNATYQISRLLALWFQTRRFLKVLVLKSIFSLCDLDIQQTRTILTIIKEDHIRIISASLVKIQAVVSDKKIFSCFSRSLCKT